MISRNQIETSMFESLRLAATRMPPDIREALEEVLEKESDPLSRRHLEVTLENARLASEGRGLVCGDTGFPLFFISVGAAVQIEGGYHTLWEAARSATRQATEEDYLRPTMVDPLTRKNPGTNIGDGMPRLQLRFDGPPDLLDITAAPKGGGSEIFGTFYRMLFPSDGTAGIFKFVIDSIREGCYAGKICPPAIIGVGIGGTADLCMSMAKRAAVLRPVGTRNPDGELRAIEEKLLQASRALGIGPMGSRGSYAVLAVHVQRAATHTAALPVAVNAQCSIGRRWRALIREGKNTEYTGEFIEATV
ncbi:MAG: fumarate hydratase [Spirochaetales bacterium]|nr:fumarate hydratase [Spirochaetales bacterium]